MLFIQAINHCIKKLEKYINQQVGLKEGSDWEKELVKKLVAFQEGSSRKRVPDDIAEFMGEQFGEMALNDPLDSQGIKDDDDNQNPLLEDDDLEKKWILMVQVPANGIKQDKFYSPEKRAIDKTPLKINGNWGNTWGEMINKRYDVFWKILKNNLGEQAYFDNNFFILARFLRQLRNIVNKGQAVLKARDEYREGVSQKKIDSDNAVEKAMEVSVERWMLDTMKDAVSEVKDLIKENKGKTTIWDVSKSLYFQVEDLVKATEKALEDHLKKMIEIEGLIKETGIRITDTLQAKENTQNPFPLSISLMFRYLIANLFTTKKEEAYKERLPLAPSKFNPDMASRKRTVAEYFLMVLATKVVQKFKQVFGKQNVNKPEAANSKVVGLGEDNNQFRLELLATVLEEVDRSADLVVGLNGAFSVKERLYLTYRELHNQLLNLNAAGSGDVPEIKKHATACKLKPIV